MFLYVECTEPIATQESLALLFCLEHTSLQIPAWLVLLRKQASAFMFLLQGSLFSQPKLKWPLQSRFLTALIVFFLALTTVENGLFWLFLLMG